MFALVQYPGVNPLKISCQPRGFSLSRKILLINTRQDEAPQFLFPAVFKEFAGMGQWLHAMSDILKSLMKPKFDLFRRGVGNKPLIKMSEWKAEFRPKLIERQFRNPRATKHLVSRLPDGWQVIHQCA